MDAVIAKEGDLNGGARNRVVRRKLDCGGTLYSLYSISNSILAVFSSMADTEQYFSFDRRTASSIDLCETLPRTRYTSLIWVLAVFTSPVSRTTAWPLLASPTKRSLSVHTVFASIMSLPDSASSGAVNSLLRFYFCRGRCWCALLLVLRL